MTGFPWLYFHYRLSMAYLGVPGFPASALVWLDFSGYISIIGWVWCTWTCLDFPARCTGIQTVHHSKRWIRGLLKNIHIKVIMLTSGGWLGEKKTSTWNIINYKHAHWVAMYLHSIFHIDFLWVGKYILNFPIHAILLYIRIICYMFVGMKIHFKIAYKIIWNSMSWWACLNIPKHNYFLSVYSIAFLN